MHHCIVKNKQLNEIVEELIIKLLIYNDTYQPI